MNAVPGATSARFHDLDALRAAALVQTAYTWLMCFGLMGLFRWVAATERPWVRYVSDSSYWLYLMHLPLALLAQEALAEWDVSVHLKFALIVAAVTAPLLAVYHVGGAAHGRRRLPQRPAPDATPAS